MKNNLILLLCAMLATSICCHAQKSGGTDGFRVGEYRLYVLTENQGTGDIGIFGDIPEDVKEKHAPAGTFPNALHAFLIVKGDEIWLADTGFGRNTFAQLDSLGIAPEQVDHIILTHMHTDHIAGMLRGDEPAFPNADVRVSEKEFRYWTSLEEMMNAEEGRRANFLLAQKVAAAYGDRIKTELPLTLGDDRGDGIHMIESYGHSPGHVVFHIKDGDDNFLIWGDLTHAVDLQSEYPQISTLYDYDRDESCESRMKILEYASSNSIPIGGMHVAYGGIGMVSKNGQGYLFTAAGDE